MEPDFYPISEEEKELTPQFLSDLLKKTEVSDRPILFLPYLRAGMGTLGALTIVSGGTIKTASSGQRVEITNNKLDFYDSSNNKIGLFGYGNNLWCDGGLDVNGSLGVGTPTGSGTGIGLARDNAWDIGTGGGNYLRHIYMKGSIKGVSLVGKTGANYAYITFDSDQIVLNAAKTLPDSSSDKLGASYAKWNTVYYTNLASCDLPTSNSAIDVFKKIKKPQIIKGDYGERHYFKKEEFPDEMKFINDKGEPDIEYTRTLGVTVQAVRELIEKVEQLESKIK